MIKVAVGTLVLCHLISGPAPEGEEEKIVKVLGTISEIHTEKIPYFYEDKEKRVAYRVMGDELVIRTDKGGVYFVNANACLAVQDSSMKEVNQIFGKTKESTPSLIEEESSPSLPFEIQNRPSPEAVTEKIADSVHKTLISPPPPELKKKETQKSVEVKKEIPLKKEVVEKPTPVKQEEEKEKPSSSDEKKGLFDYIKE